MSTRRWPGGYPAGSTAAQLVEAARRGKAVGNSPDSGLEIADRGPGPGAEVPVRLADVVAVPFQQLLQLQPLAARQYPLVARPVLHECRSPAQAVGQVSDRQRIG